MRLFAEYQDSKEAVGKGLQLNILVFVVMLGMLAIFGQEKSEQGQLVFTGMSFLLLIYVFYLLFSSVEWNSDMSARDLFIKIFRIQREGASFRHYVVSFMVGAVVGLFYLFLWAGATGRLAVAVPYSTITLTPFAFSLIVAGILAWYIEEPVFRGFLTPTMVLMYEQNTIFHRVIGSAILFVLPALFGRPDIALALAVVNFGLMTFMPAQGYFRDLLAVVVAQIPFGIFHFYAYRGDLFFVLSAIVFGVVAAHLMALFKSIGAPQGAHAINNLMPFFIALGGGAR